MKPQKIFWQLLYANTVFWRETIDIKVWFLKIKFNEATKNILAIIHAKTLLWRETLDVKVWFLKMKFISIVFNQI